MKSLLAAGVLAAALVAGAPRAADAASLQVAPVRLSVPAGAATSKVTLRNTGAEAIDAQVRIFKWVQEKGKDRLVETRDVVISPPILKLEPNKSNVIRIVRTTKAPVRGEEAYRLMVDQLPPAGDGRGKVISFVLRYSIPVFFGGAGGNAELDWSVEMKNGKPILTVVNTGSGHARISNLSLKPQGGKPVSYGNGLIGYVLANSTARFPLKGALKGGTPGDTVLIAAEGNDGAVQAKAEIRAAN
jgi:fimbrial chaperone protein